MPVSKFLEHRFPGMGLRKDFRDELTRVCEAFISSGFAGSNYISELTSGSNGKFWSCVSEALIFDRIREMNFGVRPNAGVGPDFLVEDGNRKVWIEVVCPQPIGLPPEWLEIQSSSFGHVPHDAILLRWTSAIKEKTEKLIGSEDGRVRGYLHTGVVSESDVYVIAVNGCQLRHGPFPALHGISQFPYAVEAVFPIGPYQLKIDKKTLKCVGDGFQERYSISKPNGSSVPSYAFLDTRNKMISAIWAVDFNAGTVIGNHEPSALIHNPNAVNALPQGFLPSCEEYVATPIGNDEYQFGRVLVQPDPCK